MANLLLFTLTFLSLGLCHLSAADTYTHPDITVREYGGGTVWDGVEIKECPLSSPTQDMQPAIKHTWVSRSAVSYSKKPRWVQAKRRMKMWSRSNIIGILFLLLLAGDVETNPGPTTDEQRLLQDDLPQDEQKERPEGVIREPLPGVPLYPIRLSKAKDTLKRGAHLVYQVCGELYRPCYRSALVVEVKDTRIHVIKNSSDGVKKEWLHFTDSQFMVVYSQCRYTDDEAVERAEQRLQWRENCYHCLNNNSHHFVTWAKTGRENPLADIIESLTYQKGNGNTGTPRTPETSVPIGNVGDGGPGGNISNTDNSLTPVLTKVSITDLKKVKEGDHIMADTQHYLVASTDTALHTFTGYTCRKGKVVKENHTCTFDEVDKGERKLKEQSIVYEDSLSSREAITNAEKELEQGEWTDRDKSDKFGSDKFVTKIKTGKKYSFNEQCLFAEKNEFSCTRIGPGIAVDEGDHLVVKDKYGNYQSVLVLKHAGQSTFIVTPDLNSEDLKRYGIVKFEEDTEVYRINYKQSLPVDDVFRRAMSDRGFEVLTDCKSELSKFVAWTKTGRKEGIDVLQLKSQIAQLCPFQRKKILCVDEMQVGDHLIRAYRTYWWHFMVTEVHPSDPFKFKTIYCNNNHISETEETLDPSKNDVYRIVYPESLPVATAIERARSKLGTYFSPLGRMWFVRWAKTGSEDGIEVDFLLNNAMPASKSRICTFAQLNPGDYLVEEESKLTKWHHYLVTKVTSPSSCSAIETWWTIKERVITFNEKSTYYRLNYNDGACISTEQVIRNAKKLLEKRIFTETQYERQELVNYLKTGNATRIKIDILQDDRTLLRRERVKSASELCPGDHIERLTPLSNGVYHHMMVSQKPEKPEKPEKPDQPEQLHHGRKCTVIHFDERLSKAAVKEEEVDISEEDIIFRIKYPERYEPEQGIAVLRRKKSLEDYPEYAPLKNKDEHLIMEATVGERLSIQVTEDQRRALEQTTAAVIYSGLAFGKINVAAARGAASQIVVKSISNAIAKGGARAVASAGAYGTADAAEAGAEALFQLGYRAALSGTAIGIVAGVAVAANLVIEAPFLARAVYKLHRKKTFHQISHEEYKRGVVQASFTSANTIAGGIGGAVVGQVAIPVPGVGAAIGGAVGSIVGQACGRAEGWAASRIISDPRAVTLPQLIETSFIDNPPPMDEKKKAE